MVSSGSTNSVWPLELAPWMTPSISRCCPAITGTTKRSLRMVTNSSCSTPSSWWARRKRSSESWIDFFCFSMSRRNAAERDAGVVGHRAVGQDLARQVLQQRRGIRRCAARAARGAGSVRRRREDGLACRRRGRAARSDRRSLGIEAGAFDAQLVGGGSQIGDAGEIEANGRAARGRLRLGRGAQILRSPPRFRPGSSISAARSACGSTCVELAPRPAGSRRSGPAAR